MKLIPIYYEGNDDGAVLDALRKAKLLPDALMVTERGANKAGGKDGLATTVWPLVDPNAVGGRAIVIVDYDESTADKMGEWFRKLLTEKAADRVTVEMTAASSRLRLYRLAAGEKTGAVVLCPIGLPEDSELVALYGLKKFAMDEYPLRLIRHEAVCTKLNEFRSLPHATVLRLMTEVGQLFHDNGIDVTKSKSYLQITLAAAQSNMGTAKLYERLLEKAAGALPPDEFRRLMSPLIDDIHEAVRLLTTP